MSNPSDRLSLSDTQQLATAAGSRLDFVFVVNPGAALVYLNMWISHPNETPGTPAADDRDGGPWPVPAGFAGVIPVGYRADAVMFSASTGTDTTGTPAADLELVPHWE